MKEERVLVTFNGDILTIHYMDGTHFSCICKDGWDSDAQGNEVDEDGNVVENGMPR